MKDLIAEGRKIYDAFTAKRREIKKVETNEARVVTERVVTDKVVGAFMSGMPKRVSNTSTDGKILKLYNNPIAKWENGKLYISSAGYQTATTKERLNGIPGVSVNQKQGMWYLNGKGWINNESWTEVVGVKQTSLAEAYNFINISPAYLKKLRETLIKDAQKNPSSYKINQYTVDVDSRAGTVGWSSPGGFTLLATPFFDDQLGIPINIEDADGKEIKNIPVKREDFMDSAKPDSLIGRLTTDIRKDVRMVKTEWLRMVKKELSALK